MTISVAPTEFTALSALRSFMLGVLPSGVEVIRGQANRVPQPKTLDFVVMTPIRRTRLETNVDTFVDTRCVGSIVGTVMEITSVTYGTLSVGSIIFGPNVATNTRIAEQLSGSVGGTGTYSITPSQSIGTGTILAAGVFNALQPVNFCIQLDLHGPNSADNAHRVSTLLRDDYGVRAFADSDINVIPLYADDPRQMPFINAEGQYEDRWILEANIQVNESVLDVPQQFFDEIVLNIVAADLVTPPPDYIDYMYLYMPVGYDYDWQTLADLPGTFLDWGTLDND